MIERFGVKVIVIAIISLMLVASLLFGLSQCSSKRTAKKQAEVSQGQGQASIGAGAEAMNTAGNVSASDDATDAAVAKGQAAVRNTPDGLKGAATKREACKLKTYANTPQCKEQAR